MAQPPQGKLFQAVQAYKQVAAQRLSPEEVKRAQTLMRQLNYALPGRNLLDATLETMDAAAKSLLQQGVSKEDLLFLRREIGVFFDTALQEGFISYHPLRKSARIHVGRQVVASPSVGERISPIAEWVENVVEESLERGLLISPLAIPFAEVEEKEGLVDRIATFLFGRWAGFTDRLSWLVQGFKIGLPVLSIILAVNAWFGPNNPLYGGYGNAMEMGNVWQDLKLAVNLLDGNPPMDDTSAGSLVELGDRLDLPLERAAKVFTLVRAHPREAQLILRHKETGTLAFISPRHLVTIRGKRVKVFR